MIYDVCYWTEKGRRLNSFDRDTQLPTNQEQAGVLRQCIAKTERRPDIWLDEKGREIPAPAWW